MKIKYLLYSLIVFLLSFFVFDLLFPARYSKTTDADIKELSLKHLSKWQDFLRSGVEIEDKGLEYIFDSGIDANAVNYEERMRKFYNIGRDFPVSVLGILMQLKKEDLLFDYDESESLLTRNFDSDILKEYKNNLLEKYEYAKALILKDASVQKNDESDIVAVLIIYHIQFIDMEFSKIRGKSIVDILSLAPDGSISDKDLEKAFLEKVKSF